MEQFVALSVAQWQQFSEVTVEFHPRLTILTGANGSGKTTLLRILAQHRGWPALHMSTPVSNKITGAIEHLTRWFRGVDKSNDNRVGSINYSNGMEAPLVIPSGAQSAFQLQIQNQRPVNCIFMPSHRQVFRYHPVTSIPTTRKTEQNAFDEVFSVALQQWQGGSTQPTSFFMKSTLIGWAIQGHGVRTDRKTIMPPDRAQREAFEGFQEALRKVLPVTLGFEELEVRNMEIVLVCNRGKDEFLLESVSGGVATLFDLTWQLFMFSRANPGPFTVLIDEAENHLHPALQKTLLGDLLVAFPAATFIVSTHSPLVVTSVRDAAVYVLRYNADRKVVSERLHLEERARNASEVLDEVLGVSSSLPVWVEREMSQILRGIQDIKEPQLRFRVLRERLSNARLGHLLPEAITSSLERKS